MKKKIVLLTLITLAMLACTNNKKDNKKVKDVEIITLQPLQENETLCYEDELRRISGSWAENYDGFIIRVEAKREDVKSFTVQDATAFECVVADALILSNGTSNVRTLNVYDLNSCDELLSIKDNFSGEVMPDDNQTGFTFYKYSEDMPIVQWNAQTGEWHETNKVPSELFNSDFHNTIEEIGDRAFNGMRLAALQKTYVNIKNKKISYLNEYKWKYIE